MLWHRTLGWQRVVIWAAKQRCHDLFRRTDKGINRVHRAHHRHLLAVGFGLLLRIMALDRGFRGRSPYRNPLPIGTHHAQGAFLLGLGSRSTSRSVHTWSVSPAAIAGVHGRHTL